MKRIIAIIVLLSAVSLYGQTGIVFNWDTYDTTIPSNKHVTHLELCLMNPDSTIKRVIAPDIRIYTSQYTLVWQFVPNTIYYFALRASAPGIYSAFSNMVAVADASEILFPTAPTSLRAKIEEE